MTIFRVISSYAKFLIKVRVVTAVRTAMLFFAGRPQGADQAVPRILIVNLEAIGDMFVFTGVLKHYRQAFPGREITLLIKEGLGIEEVLAPFVDHVMTVNYRRFAINPWYGVGMIRRLRGYGFALALAHDHAAVEVIGQRIALESLSRETIAYEGFALQREQPLDIQMARNVEYARRILHPRFTRVIPSLDRATVESPDGQLRSTIEHLAAFYESATGRHENEYASQAVIPQAAEGQAIVLLRRHKLPERGYAVVNLCSSSTWKNWPAGRFAAACGLFQERDIPIFLIGASHEEEAAKQFVLQYQGAAINLVGKLTIPETLAVVAKSLLVFSNDTSPVHMAVATKTPSVCVIGGGHFGHVSLYGYRDINRWVYHRTPCFGDNWRCTIGLASGSIAPCLEAVTAEEARAAIAELLDYLRRHRSYPRYEFSPAFHGTNE